MPDARFSGDLDAPPARSATLCSEHGCGQGADGPNHVGNKSKHFFNPGAPLLSRSMKEKTVKRQSNVPSAAAEVKPQAKAPPALSSGGVKSPPSGEARIEARITDEVVKALRQQTIASHLRIRRIEVKPEYSVDDDTQLLAADVSVHLHLVFPYSEREE